MRTIFGDVLAALWLPVFSGTVAAAITWLVWYYAGGPAVPGSEAAKLCAKAPLACYITPSALHYCILHSGIFITLTGGPDIMLFIRERRRNERERRETEERRQEERKEAEERRQEERKETEERRREERKEAEERRQQEQERYRQEQERRQQEQERYRKEAEERRQQEQERRQQEQERYLKEAEERRQQEQERYERMFNLLQTALEQAHTERRLSEERAAEERRLAEERYRQDQQRVEERAAADRQEFANLLAQFAATIAGGVRQEPGA